MLRRSLPLVLVGVLFVGVATAALVGSLSSFLSAPAGQPVPYQVVELPPVKLPTTALAPSASSARSGVSFWQLAAPDAWQPSIEQLVNGDTVIETEDQMRDVWARLFKPAYDASLFDFDSDFVVLMGGGALQLASFGISAVERVDAQYSIPLFAPPAAQTDPFLSVTGTHVWPGILPSDPPPAQYVVSAVRIAKDQLDDVVFHRNGIALP